MRPSIDITMNIISPKNNVNTVSLKELIPEHETLKLLILHTPFPLQIATLPQCLSLVKLDLSRNKIKSFPYLGHLQFLRIAFLHENQLGVNQFIRIFERNGERSTLSDNIVWISYWGNKNVFLARHYAVNKTNALAFDKNIIVQEERMPNLSNIRKAFCRQSDISEIFFKRNVSNYSTEEEYMQDFWITLRMLRLKNQNLNPIIKVQKVYRGWIFRQKLKRQYIREKENYFILYNCFKQWKNSRKKQKKLYEIMKKTKKAYLLYPSSKINREYIYNKMKELAQMAKEAVLQRRLRLDNQIKFYSILKGNYQTLLDLYAWLELKKSTAIYIYKDNISQFKDYVVPFVKLFCTEQVQFSTNQNYHLHYLHQPISKYQLQFIKIIKTNRLSIASYEKPLEKMLKLIKFKKPTPIQSKMKSIFGKFHISSNKKLKMEEYQKRLEVIKSQEKNQLIKIQGSFDLLKTIVRGIFFFNSKRLNLSQTIKIKRVNFLSQRALKQISSAVSIQRAWKGYIFRKKHQSELKLILRVQKAATIIQRWFRKLPTYRKKYFVLDIQNKLDQCTESSFIVDYDNYFEYVKKANLQRDYYIFLEQHSQVYKHKITGELAFTWDDQSKRQQIYTLINIHKSHFPQNFYRKKIGFSQQQISKRAIYHEGKLERCEFAHILHYQTQTSIIKRFDKKFLHVQCHKKSEAKFRIFCLSLITYNSRKRKSIKFYSKQSFLMSQLKNKQQICKRQLSIICNQNTSFIKTIEQNCNDIDNLSINIIENKIFLQLDLSKPPFKVEERFFIYLINHAQNGSENEESLSYNYNHSELKRNKVFIDEIPQNQASYHIHSVHSGSSDVVRWQQARKILVKKKSIKQFKAKIKKRRQNHPNFIIDNKSTDRITQNQSQLLDSSNRQLKNDKDQLQKSVDKKELNHIRALIMHEKSKRILQLKREQQSFTKKFVNLGNFMQNQFVNDHRRKMKTQIELLAHASAEEIRLSANRSASHKEEKINRRYAKARELQEVHKSLIRQSLVEGQQRSVLLRKNVQSYHQRSKEERKRPRISFAEQSFPIIGQKGRNFSVG